MLRRTTLVVFAITLALGAASASAQLPCIVGAYTDADGTSAVGTAVRDLGDPRAYFDVYYVLFTEDFVNAVAWNREVTGFGGNLTFLDEQEYFGTFLDSQDGIGFRLGIGTCVIGFGGVPITLMRERWGIIDDYTPSGGMGEVVVLPNVLENENYPVYNTCNNDIRPCEAGRMLVTRVVPNDSDSWGSVKALFNSN